MYESHISMIKFFTMDDFFHYIYLFHMCFRCTPFVFRQYKTMENGIQKIIIAKSWPIKFVMTFPICCPNFHYHLLLEFMSQEKKTPQASNPK